MRTVHKGYPVGKGDAEMTIKIERCPAQFSKGPGAIRELWGRVVLYRWGGSRLGVSVILAN